MLISKINDRQAVIGVIGLGYVGLPLVREFSRAGFSVIGFDIDDKKVDALRAGRSYIKHFPSATIQEWSDSGKFTPTTDFALLKKVDCVVICVPTPLNEYREPDLSYVFDTTRSIAKYLHKGQLIVLESTTYPGTTDEDMRAILEESGLKAGVDFNLAFSPEREDPNNPDFNTRSIPKVVGGFTPQCLEAAKAMYDTIVDHTIPVSSTKVAESTKLLENIYRCVNIALVNELKMLFDRMGIDVWEVINAAKTKPFGFQAFFPGPGLGGHCIPIDPFYLTWKAREFDFATRFIELAGDINARMPYYVVDKVVEALGDQGKVIKGASVLVLGLAYKKDIDDIRESPSLKLIELLRARGAKVDYYDPYITEPSKGRRYSLENPLKSIDPGIIASFDCVLIATDHSVFDKDMLINNAKLIVDTRNLIPATPGREKTVKKA